MSQPYLRFGALVLVTAIAKHITFRLLCFVAYKIKFIVVVIVFIPIQTKNACFDMSKGALQSTFEKLKQNSSQILPNFILFCFSKKNAW